MANRPNDTAINYYAEQIITLNNVYYINFNVSFFILMITAHVYSIIVVYQFYLANKNRKKKQFIKFAEFQFDI